MRFYESIFRTRKRRQNFYFNNDCRRRSNKYETNGPRSQIVRVRRRLESWYFAVARQQGNAVQNGKKSLVFCKRVLKTLCSVNKQKSIEISIWKLRLYSKYFYIFKCFPNTVSEGGTFSVDFGWSIKRASSKTMYHHCRRFRTDPSCERTVFYDELQQYTRRALAVGSNR